MSDNGAKPGDAAAPTAEEIDKLWNEMQVAEDDAKKPDGPQADPHDISTDGKVDDTSSVGGGGQPSSGASRDGGGQGPKSPVTVPPAAAAPSTPDLWASATPEQRAAYEAAETARQRAETGSRANAGRIRQLQDQVERLKGSVGRATDNQAPNVGDTLKERLAEFPEVAGPVQDALGQIEKRIDAGNVAVKAQIELHELEIANHVASQLEVLDAAIPGWETKYAKGGSLHTEYARWANDEAPGRLRRIIAENNEHVLDAHGAAQVFQAFEDFRAAQVSPPGTPAPQAPNGQSQELSQRRSAQLDAAAHPQNSRRPPTLGTVPKDVDDPEAHWKELEANDPDERRWAERAGRRR
jgi:hypothetical protein